MCVRVRGFELLIYLFISLLIIQPALSHTAALQCQPGFSSLGLGLSLGLSFRPAEFKIQMNMTPIHLRKSWNPQKQTRAAFCFAQFLAKLCPRPHITHGLPATKLPGAPNS